MKRYNGGNWVHGGYYLNLKTWEVRGVAGHDGALPGEPDEQFVKLPLPMVFVVAAVLGVFFALFLPFIGFAAMFYLGGRAIKRALPHGAAKVAH